MDIIVTLFADLRRFGPKNHEGSISLTLEVGATVEEMLTAVGIPDDESIRSEITVGLNGALSQRDSILKDGDEVMIFSPMEGG